MLLILLDRVALPALVPLSTEVLYPQGAYLMDNGRIFVLWLGREVSPQFLEDVCSTVTSHFSINLYPDMKPFCSTYPIESQVPNLQGNPQTVAFLEDGMAQKSVPFEAYNTPPWHAPSNQLVL